MKKVPDSKINTKIISSSATSNAPEMSFNPDTQKIVPLVKNSKNMTQVRLDFARKNLNSVNTLSDISLPKIYKGVEDAGQNDPEVRENQEGIKKSWVQFFENMKDKITKGEPLPSFDTALDELAIDITDKAAMKQMQKMIESGDISQMTQMLGKDSGKIMSLLGGGKGGGLNLNIPGLGNLGGIAQKFLGNISGTRGGIGSLLGSLGGGRGVGKIMKNISDKIPKKLKLEIARKTDLYKQGLAKTKISLRKPKSIRELKKVYERIQTQHNLNIQGKKLVSKFKALSFEYTAPKIDLKGKVKKTVTGEELEKNKEDMKAGMGKLLNITIGETDGKLGKDLNPKVKEHLKIFKGEFKKFYESIRTELGDNTKEMSNYSELVNNLAKNIVRKITIKLAKQKSGADLSDDAAFELGKQDPEYLKGLNEIMANFNKNDDLKKEFGDLYNLMKFSHDNLMKGIVYENKVAVSGSSATQESEIPKVSTFQGSQVKAKNPEQPEVKPKEKQKQKSVAEAADDLIGKNKTAERAEALAKFNRNLQVLRTSTMKGIDEDQDTKISKDAKTFIKEFWRNQFNEIENKKGKELLPLFDEDKLSKKIVDYLFQKIGEKYKSNFVILDRTYRLIEISKSKSIKNTKAKFHKPHEVIIENKKEMQSLIQGYNKVVKEANALIDKK